MEINNKFKDTGAERLIYWGMCIFTFGFAFAVRIIISEGVRQSFKK